MRLIAWALCALTLAACNDTPSIVGSEIVPGTDTIYATTSIEMPYLPSDSMASYRIPLTNGTYFLLGRTAVDDARAFVELVDYPDLGPDTAYDVVKADLLLYPQSYKYGDTADATIAFTAYELTKAWSANATWDSIFTENGTTDYYSTASPALASVNGPVTTPADSVYPVAFDLAAVKRWMVLGRDEATRSQVYGFALHPTNTSVIRQFRNLSGINQVMRLRVVHKRRSDTNNVDTAFVNCVVANFVNTPQPQPGEIVVQGARIHRGLLRVDLDTIPSNAIILGGTLRITLNMSASQTGSFGLDEVLAVRYAKANVDTLTLVSRRDADGVFLFENIGPLLQLMRRNGGSGELTIEPTGTYETWRMNRLRLFTLVDDPFKRPRLTVAYTIPGVFDK